MAQVSEIGVEIKGDSSSLKKAVSGAERSLGDLRSESSKTEGEVENLSGTMDGAGGKMGALSSMAGGLASAIAGVTAAAGAAAAGITTLTTQMGQSEKKARAYARTLGVTREQLQGLTAIGAQFGADISDTMDALSEVNTEMNDLKRGSGRLQKALQGTNADLDKLSEASGPVDFLNRLSEESDKLSDSLKATVMQAALGEEAFRQFGPVIMDSEKSLSDMIGRMKEMNVILGNQASANLASVGDAFHQLKLSIKGVAKAISAAAAPSVRLLMKTATGLIGAFREAAPSIDKTSSVLFNLTKSAIIPALDGFQELSRLTSKTAKVSGTYAKAITIVTNVVTSLGKSIVPVVSLLGDFIEMALEGFKAFGKKLAPAIAKSAKAMANIAQFTGMEGLSKQMRDAAEDARSFGQAIEVDYVGPAEQAKSNFKELGKAMKKTFTTKEIESFFDSITDSANISEKAIKELKEEIKGMDEDAPITGDGKGRGRKGVGGRGLSDQSEKSQEALNVLTKDQLAALRRITEAKRTAIDLDDIRAKKAKKIADINAKIDRIKGKQLKKEKKARKLAELREKKEQAVVEKNNQLQKAQERRGDQRLQRQQRTRRLSARRGGENPLAKIISGFSRSTAEIQNLNAEIDRLNSKIEDTSSAQEKAALLQKKQNKQIQKDIAQRQNLQGGIKTAGAAFKNSLSIFQQLASSIDTLSTSVDGFAQNIRAERQPGLSPGEKRGNTLKDIGKGAATAVGGAAAGAGIGAAAGAGPIGAAIGGGVGLIAGVVSGIAGRSKRQKKEKIAKRRQRFQTRQMARELGIAKTDNPMAEQQLRTQKKLAGIAQKVETGQMSKKQGKIQAKILREQLRTQKEQIRNQRDLAEMQGNVLDARLAGNETLATQLKFDKRRQKARNRIDDPKLLEQTLENINKREKLTLRQTRNQGLGNSSVRRKFGQEIGREAGREIGRKFARGEINITVADPTQISAEEELGSDQTRDLQDQLDREDRQTV